VQAAPTSSFAWLVIDVHADEMDTMRTGFAAPSAPFRTQHTLKHARRVLTSDGHLVMNVLITNSSREARTAAVKELESLLVELFDRAVTSVSTEDNVVTFV
jgi:hypothetical protein